MKPIRLLPLIPLLAVLTACAGLEVKDVSTLEADNAALGVRYYESSPYLLVHTNNEGGLTTRILYLPDRTKKRSIRPYSKLARGTSTLQFENGVLTTANNELDASAVPKAIVSALEKAATSFILGASKGPGQDQPPQAAPPYLFKIIVNGDSIELRGSQGVGPIFVNVPKEG